MCERELIKLSFSLCVRVRVKRVAAGSGIRFSIIFSRKMVIPINLSLISSIYHSSLEEKLLAAALWC